MQPSTKYITLLRHPKTLLASVFYYEKFDQILQKFGLPKPSAGVTEFDEFFKDPMRIYKAALPNESSVVLMRNGMLFDLGFNIHKAKSINDDTIRIIIGLVSRDFDLVLIMEYFDESLVVMMREFCWSFVSFTSNRMLGKQRRLKYKLRL